MPGRTVSQSFRHQSHAVASDDVFLLFATISHEELYDSIRVVNDTVDYTYSGNTWIGFPFDISILSDDENPPSANIEFQNVDTLIGRAIQALRSAPRLKLELLSSSDFNLAVTPRTAIGSPAVEWMGDKLFLSNVSADALTISASIVGWDYLQRSWPGIRASQNRLPGLFR